MKPGLPYERHSGRIAVGSPELLSELRWDVFQSVGPRYGHGVLYGIGFTEGLIDALRVTRTFQGCTDPVAQLAGPALPLLFEDGACGSPLVQRRHHREHDRDVAVAGSAKDRPQLRAQEIGTVQQHTDAALAEERIVLARQRQVWQRLVAADIERPHDQPPSGPHRARDVAVDGELLLFGRRGRAMEEQEQHSKYHYQGQLRASRS